MSEHEIVLSFTDMGDGHYDRIAIVDRSSIPPSVLADFLRYLAGEMANGDVEVGAAS